MVYESINLSFKLLTESKIKENQHKSVGNLALK